MAEKKETKPQIRKLWGMAKSPELHLSDEDLHLFVQKYTGKSSIAALNSREIGTVIRELGKLKDSVHDEGKPKRWGGNPQTENQRKKIYVLTKELGWDKRSRVNGMAKRMFGCDDVNWLNFQQCSKLIEALKKMLERQEEGKEREQL